MFSVQITLIWIGFYISVENFNPTITYIIILIN